MDTIPGSSRQFLIDFADELKKELDRLSDDMRSYVSRQETRRECLMDVLQKVDNHLRLCEPKG